MEERYHHILLPTSLRDDRQRSVHGRGTPRRDGSQRSKHLCQQGSNQEGEYLPIDIRQESHRPQFRPTILGNEDTGYGIIGKAASHRHTVGDASVLQEEPCHKTTSKAAQYRRHGQQCQSWIQRSELAHDIVIAADAHSHTEEQAA